jgi:aldehyde dehydrogenase (NAD+)
MNKNILGDLGLGSINSGTYAGGWINDSGSGELIPSSPTDLAKLGAVSISSAANVESAINNCSEVFKKWRLYPAPKRGELVRQIGDKFREKKSDLAKLITLEMGKPLSESEGEVQEVIDICDFAVGLSRMLYGLSMHSERASHRMYEQWHPLGVVGVITAFNFPAAVWAWNAMIAAVCGDTVIWKASEKTPLTAVACLKISEKVFSDAGFQGVFNLVTGGASVGETLCKDPRVALISATGSTAMGKKVGKMAADRFAKSLLELGGNNAIIVLEDADLELAARAIAFGAAGTTGQRCTTTRRLIVQSSIYDALVSRLKTIYAGVQIGDPLDKSNAIGPLIDQASVDKFLDAIKRSLSEGGKIICGGNQLKGKSSPLFVEPTIILADKKHALPKEETFAPILYIIKVDSLDEAIEINNDVQHGLSSAIFSNNLRATEKFLSTAGSDCGIANVNIGTSGAEIGGAFGGEKETGGGREAGSDSWKAYMRRQTSTINYGTDLPLAQGVVFAVKP